MQTLLMTALHIQTTEAYLAKKWKLLANSAGIYLVDASKQQSPSHRIAKIGL